MSCASLVQKILVLFWSLNIVLNSQSRVIKRSPLELGYATFPSDNGRHSNLIIINGTKAESEMDKINVDLPLPAGANKVSHIHEWIPGQIRHHSFIPAHVHHILLPVIIAKTVIVKPTENLYEYDSRPYGGYGLGAYTGGQGAGHGFQIIFND